MKITPKQYAVGLYELTEGGKTSNVDSVLNNFVIFLSNNNDLGLFDKIVVEFSKIFDEKNSIANVSITSASRLDAKTVDLLKNSLSKKLKKDSIIIDEKIDKDILGGIILRHEDTVLDGSLRKRIDNLKYEISK